MGARLGLGPMALREVEDRSTRAGQADAAQRKAARRRIASGPGAAEGATLVALDGRGGSCPARNLPDGWDRRRDQGCRNLVFIIGGADGLSDALVTQRTSKRLSLGAMTWPHMLVRIMLAEQIYRAVTILANHPYHRGYS